MARVEAEPRSQRIPFKSWEKLIAIYGHGPRVMGKMSTSDKTAVQQEDIFRTKLPEGEPRGSITFAEVIPGKRFQVWNVLKENSEETIRLITQLYAWHKDPFILNQEKVVEIISQLYKFDLGNSNNPKTLNIGISSC